MAPAAEPPQVDVLVVNYRTPELTCAAVAAVAGPDVALWVRDNSADIDPEQLAAAAAGTPCELRSDARNTLYAAGNNELYALGRAPLVLLLNPDVLLARADLAAMVEALGADDRLWAVAPRLLNPDGSPQDYYRRLPDLPVVLADRVPPLRRVLRRAWARHTYAGERLEGRAALEAPPGACLLLRRDAVGPVLFDERFSLFYNDTDLSRRMAAAGRRVELVPGASAVHGRGVSLAKARDRDPWVVARLYDRNALAYARAHLRGWQLVALVVAGRSVAERAQRLAQRVKRNSPSA